MKNSETLEAEGLIKTPEVAQRAKVSRRTVQTWTAQKVIPVVRISPRCVRYKWQDVERALAKFTVKEAA
jgi:excisionase family DNA binding protein